MKKNEYQVLGIMSGTSLDGIDLALLQFRKEQDWQYEIITAETIPYSEEWQSKLGKAVHYSEDQLRKLDREYTGYLANTILSFKGRHSLKNLDAVCSHGHTVKHQPQQGFTLQIGNLPALAQVIGETVVCDFRVQDVKLGGQGAPLVPIGDELLFREFSYCLNLGGFANLSTRIGGRRIAYDICAVNTVLNQLSEKIGVAYDDEGSIAAGGKLLPGLLRKLDALKFYKKDPPKSLGIEWVHEQISPLLKDVDIPSALHTYTVHAAAQIASCLNNQPSAKVLVTGGGAFNHFLMDRIRMATNCSIITPDPELVNFKEALIFGFLGVLRLREEVNVLRSVTGASADHSSGKIFTPA